MLSRNRALNSVVDTGQMTHKKRFTDDLITLFVVLSLCFFFVAGADVLSGQHVMMFVIDAVKGIKLTSLFLHRASERPRNATQLVSLNFFLQLIKILIRDLIKIYRQSC